MSNVSVANTDSGLASKTVDLLESDQTITGLKTFSRGAAVTPFAVAAASAKVANLDADKLDGMDWSTIATDLLFTDATYDIGKTGATRPRDGFFSRNVTIGSLLTLAGGQLFFPVAQNSSADVNTLDDYEEGTWTIQLTFGGASVGVTFSNNTGWYVKLGKLVIVGGSFTLTAKGSSVGNASITGLPFTSQNTASLAGALYFSRTIALTTITWLDGSIPINGTSVNLASGATVANDTHFQNTTSTDGFFGGYIASA